jgi:ubiquitin-conjugating enzyme E2 O
VQSLFGFLIGNNRPNNVDTVVAVKHTVLAIAWLAVNQSVSSAFFLEPPFDTAPMKLDPDIAQARKRPQRFWFGRDLSKLTMVRSKSEQDMRVGEKVLLKNSDSLPSTTHGQEGDPGVVVVHTFVVRQTCTDVTVLWQDGVHEMVKSTNLIPYLNPDESDCWWVICG